MKTEIELSELLKQITPLPYIPTERGVYNKGGLKAGGQIAYTGDPTHAAYLTHCANVLPELVEALNEISRDGWSGDRSRLTLMAKTADAAISRAEKVKLP